MYELEVWNKYVYPSCWEYEKEFLSVDEAVVYAEEFLHGMSWRVISTVAES